MNTGKSNSERVSVGSSNLVRLLDLRPENWPSIMPPGTQFRDLETGEWIEDYAGWDREKAMEDVAHQNDPRGAMSLRIPVCIECRGTGIIGDEGPGRHGSREYVTCDCRLAVAPMSLPNA